jgi:hypothetical protein
MPGACAQELPCGHFMHSHCFAAHTRYNYTCPVCAKSLGDMGVYFGMLDSILARDTPALPAAYAARRQVCALPLGQGSLRPCYSPCPGSDQALLGAGCFPHSTCSGAPS